MEQNLDDLLRQAKEGHRRSLSRLITRVETGGREARDVLRAVWPLTGEARIIGITGPPGSGKSTLTDKIAKACRSRGNRVGIIAVDPSSPFTGGAILGDRVRMSDLNLDEGVYIRSMGTRGQLGGLSAACTGAAKVLDACGFDTIILETVGVGQSEVSVMHASDVVVVVTVPGLGDDVQAIKAGILEIGDIFVVNKSDHPGADKVSAELRFALELDPAGEKKDAPILLTSAVKNEGVEELLDALELRLARMREDGELENRRVDRLRQEVVEIIQTEISRRILQPVLGGADIAPQLRGFLSRRENPYDWTETMLERIIINNNRKEQRG